MKRPFQHIPGGSKVNKNSDFFFRFLKKSLHHKHDRQRNFTEKKLCPILNPINLNIQESK